MSTYRNLAAWQVEWYRRNGKYPERIVRDSLQVEYVIGDWSWERNHPGKPEYVDGALSAYCQSLARAADQKAETK